MALVEVHLRGDLVGDDRPSTTNHGSRRLITRCLKRQDGEICWKLRHAVIVTLRKAESPAML